MKFLESAANARESFVHCVGKLQQIQLLAGYRSPIHHLAEVDHASPVAPAVDQDQVAPVKLAGLHQREHLPQFVHGAEAARENDQRLGQLREPQLAHEEVVELKIELRTDV